MSHKSERKVAVLHLLCSLDGCIDRRCHHHHQGDTSSSSCHFHRLNSKGTRGLHEARQSSTNLLVISLLALVTMALLVPLVDGGMMKKKKEDKKCMPEIVAIKKVKIVPVAVPIKSMSGSTMTTYTEEIMTDGKMPMKMKPAPTMAPGKPSKPPKYEDEEEMNKPQVMQVPVYNTDSGEEEEEEEAPEEEEEEHSPYDSAMAEHVDGGDAYSTSGGGDDDESGDYKRRRDEQVTPTRSNQSTSPRHKRHIYPPLMGEKSGRVKLNNNVPAGQATFIRLPGAMEPVSVHEGHDVHTLFSQRLMAIMSKSDESNLAAAVSSLYTAPIPLASPIDSIFSPAQHLQSSFLNRLRNMSKGHEMH